MQSRECVVCEAETCIRLRPCNHTVCMKCTKLWTERSVTCPVCRRAIEGCHGREEGAKGEVEEAGVLVRCSLGPYHHAGVTLDHGVKKGRVVVTRINRKDAFFRHGMRVGDSVLSVNDLPVKSSHVAIAIVEACRKSEQCVVLHIEQRRVKWVECVLKRSI